MRKAREMKSRSALDDAAAVWHRANAEGAADATEETASNTEALLAQNGFSA